MSYRHILPVTTSQTHLKITRGMLNFVYSEQPAGYMRYIDLFD